MMNRDRSPSLSLHRRNRWTILLLVMLLTAQSLFLHPGQALASAGFTITATTPSSNAQNVALGATIALTFNIDLNTATATNSTVVINGSMSGVVSATFSYNAGTRTLTLTPSRSFKAGEVVSVNATSGVKSSSAASLTPYAFQFTPGLQNNRCVDGFSSSSANVPGISDGAVAWGDYNNDGYADLALVGNGSSGMISKIYRSNGDGSFTDSGAVLPGLQYAALAWGDYNNDGLLDVVMNGMGNSGATTKLYKNTGSGFVDSGISLQGLFWGGLAWGDYDGDGYLDLVLSGYNGGSGTTILYHNNAGVSFSNSGQALTGLFFSSAAWGDYNNDGALDLVMTGVNSGNNRVTLVYQNDGTGTLNDNGLPLTGIAQGNPAWGDYNSDGKLDLLITGSSGNGGGIPTMKLYRNDGSNSFTEVTGTGLPLMNSGTAAWGDYDNDGKPDILLAGDTTGSTKIARVYRNNGDGTFTNINAGLPGLSTGTAGTGAAAWGDYDKDGNLDLVLVGQNPNSPYNLVTGVYHNDACAPNLGIAKTVTPALATRGQAVSYTLTYSNTGTMASSSVLITDTIPAQLTGVSYQSSPALTTIGGSPYVWNVGSMPIGASGIITVSGTLNASVALGTIFTNTATIKGSPTDIHPSNDSASASALAAVLVTSTTPAANASGIAPSAPIDAIFNEAMNSGTIDASTMAAYGSMTGRLPGAFGYNAGTKKITFTPTNAYRSGEVVTVDMTSGIKDSTGASLTPKLWQFVAGPVINNRCAGSFSDTGAGLQGSYNGAAAWADYDLDGKLDLVLTGADSGSSPTTKLYHNTGSGFSVVAAGLPDLQYSTAAWGDYDKDGDPDLMLSGFDTSYNYTAKIYRNNDNGTFTDIAAGLSGVIFGSAAWGDYNNDGYLDLLLSGSNNGSPTAYIYRNNAGSSFTKLDVGITAYNESLVSWADYDSDGDLDILYSGRNDSTNLGSTRLYRNNGNDTFTNIDAGLAGVRAGSSTWGDYNQDGRPDLLLIGSTSGSSYSPISKIYRNNGGGSFTDIGAGLPGVLSGSANWVDYDNDGKLDAFVVGTTSTGNTSAAALYHNNGNGTFSDSGIAMPSAVSSSAAWGDYNNDGDMDLLLIGQGAGFAITSKIYSNNDCVTDLKIVKSAPPTAARGQLLTYTIDYGNIGQLIATNVVITDTIPAQLTGVSFQSSRTITATGTFIWQAGSLAPGASGIITVTGTINPATALDSVITNVASLSGLPAETATSNNSSTVTTQVKVEVIASNPLNHAFGSTSPINATFSDAMAAGSITNATVKLQTSTTGLVGGTLSYNAGAKQVTLTPDRALKAGELARVTLTSGVQSSTGAALLPYQWEFTADPVVANRCVGRFFDVGAGLTGGYYSSAAWGDYDKDGNLDLLISGQDSNFANFTKLYRNTGSGFSLVTGTGLPTVYLASLSWGDYDNDSYPDLLITGYDNNFGPISRVYRNNGNGTFTNINAGLNGIYYGQGAWGDYDNDGYLDLVVAGNGYTTLYHGNGTTFSDANAGLPAVWGGAVAWGDYNNDGYLDLALSGSTANSDPSGAMTRIYKNTNGSFTNSGIAMTGVWYGSLAWSDYDQDGRLDLASTGQTSVSSINSAKLYHNTASGLVDSGVALPGVYQGTVAWGDYNNDARPDLLISGDNANAAVTALYRNTGSSLTPSDLSLPAFKNGGAAWGDYNNDGALDLIQIGYNSSFVPSTSVYRNESCAAELSITKTTSQPVAGHGQTVQYLLNYSNSGTAAANSVVITDTIPAELTGLSFQSSRPITPTGSYVWQVGALAVGASGSITVTGQVDTSVTAGTIFTNTASISIAPGEANISNNNSSAATRVTFTVSNTSPQANAFPVALNAPVTLSFSEDANTSTISSASVILYGSLSGVISSTLNYNAGTRTLTLTPAVAFKQGEIIWVRATGAIKSSGGVSLQPYQWQFTAGATGDTCLDSISPITSGLPNIAADDAAWGDYDKDGDLDLLVIGDSTGKVYRNNGNGTFTDIGAGLPNATASAAAWGDYDNDGYLDFVISGNAAGAFTRLYHNNGNGSFTNMGNRGLASFYISTLAWGDYDNDSYLDLAFTGANINTGTKFTKLYHNNGNSTFSDSGISLTNVAGGSLNWGDYDKDGNLDLLLSGQDNSSAGITKLYHNNGNSTFSEATDAGLPVVTSGAVAWGDYNGDGNLDLLISGYMGSAPSSRIYRNNGNGSFSDINAGLPGLQSSAVAWGDYNNDGKLDLVLSGETRVSVPPYAPITRIYENHGSGSFSDSGFTFTGLFNTGLAWGDQDGDGFLDLLTTGFFDGSYTSLAKLYQSSPCQPDLGIVKSVMPSQATPGQPIVYTLTYSNSGTLPASSVVITDIVPAEVISPTFQSSPAVTTIGGNAYVWQVGTLAPNAGGVITITGQVSSSLTFSSIITNTATIYTPSFEANQANNSSTVVSRVTFHIISTDPGTNAQSVSPTAPISAVFNADLNASTIRSSTFLLHGSMSGIITGTQSYNAATRTLLLIPSHPFKAGEVIRVSATSDIQSTLGTSLQGYQWEFTAGITQNRCLGSFSDAGSQLPPLANSTAAWGDYDNDGRPDLLLSGTLPSSAAVTRIYHNNGDGSFSMVSAGLPGVADGAADWGDYDNDGKLDLVLIGSGSSGAIARIYHNTGSGFADSGISLPGLYSAAAAWGDYDTDGKLDLVLSGQDSSNSTVLTRLYHNNGNGSFSTVSAGFANVYSAALAWGDYNNDGSLDLLVAGNTVSSGSTSVTKLYQNNGNGTFSDSGVALQGLYSGAAAWGDYDGDGNLDLVLSGLNSAYAPVTKLYHNNGAGSLSDSGVALTNLSGSAAAWGDYDNDGKLDLVLSGSDSVNTPITKLYHNNGSGSFSTVSAGLPQTFYGALAWGDYNDDNRLELAIFGYKNNAEYVGSLYRANDCADLGIKQSVIPAQLMPGQPITYTLVYSNTGAGIANGVLITDTLPAQLISLSYTSSGPALATIGSTPYVWSAGNLAPGASGVITVTGIVSPSLSADQSISSSANISTSSLEASYANNSSGVTASVVAPRIYFSGSSYQVGEGGGSATITLTLDVANPNAAVTVVYSTADGTATAGSDYTATQGTLSIPAGQTSATFTIPIINDTLGEPAETIQISLSQPDGATLGSQASATLSIIDNDLSKIYLPLLRLT